VVWSILFNRILPQKNEAVAPGDVIAALVVVYYRYQEQDGWGKMGF
jgi:hypothetical protein